MSTLRLISIGLSGALTVMQLASGSARSAAAATLVLWWIISLLARFGFGGNGAVVGRRVRLLFFALAAVDDDDVEARGVDRERHHRRDRLARVLVGLGGLDQRAERPVDVEV